MRDLLPPASMTRTLLWQRLMETFDLYGYQRVTTPPVEYAEVIERGLGTVDRRDLVRFVEPDSGEVALLRPDITPQIARIVATRLQDRPAPWRLCYEGTIVRRRRGRARKQHQVLQCGIECIGLKGPEADAEVIEVAVRACEGVGLRDFLVELAQVKIGTEVLDHVPENARLAVVETLAAKDATNLEKLLKDAGVIAAERKRLLLLCDLYGDRSVIAVARRRLRNAAARRAPQRLAPPQLLHRREHDPSGCRPWKAARNGRAIRRPPRPVRCTGAGYGLCLRGRQRALGALRGGRLPQRRAAAPGRGGGRQLCAPPQHC
jgi:ATP phosphoribosyltransferase regulatory subunit